MCFVELRRLDTTGDLVGERARRCRGATTTRARSPQKGCVRGWCIVWRVVVGLCLTRSGGGLIALQWRQKENALVIKRHGGCCVSLLCPRLPPQRLCVVVCDGTPSLFSTLLMGLLERRHFLGKRRRRQRLLLLLLLSLLPMIRAQVRTWVLLGGLGSCTVAVCTFRPSRRTAQADRPHALPYNGHSWHVDKAGRERALLWCCVFVLVFGGPLLSSVFRPGLLPQTD